jgi:protease YdgD
VKKWPLSRVPKSGLPGFGENSAKTKESEQAFGGLPRNACLVGKAYVLLLLASLSAHAAQPENLTPGIVGADDRKRVEESGPPWDAIGQINISGYRRMSRCTGTLIAPDMVITAAHCVIDPWKKVPFPLKTIHFLAGVRGQTNKGHFKSKCVQILPGYDVAVTKKTMTLDTFAHDAAILVLDQKPDLQPVAVVNDAVTDASVPLVHAAYPADRRYVLSAHRTCRVLQIGRQRSLWFNDCDTHPASSGGPVFQSVGGEMRLAAIMVGSGGGVANIALPVSEWRAMAERRDCR